MTPPLPPRLRRALELVYAVEGVVSARIWCVGKAMAVGVTGAASSSAPELLHRVELAVAGLREPDETWDFGILGDSS